ncbi:hypothetical protein E2C01_047906 [Portunus trituberculatus]|uniref:Uncharacterized protein n=1 Tax=Portunus trituberculatus TaxID=210409 RepID=A0A5B7G1S3_PORTR|nr:hypothetical protein [Portunus trituberculatus]
MSRRKAQPHYIEQQAAVPNAGSRRAGAGRGKSGPGAGLERDGNWWRGTGRIKRGSVIGEDGVVWELDRNWAGVGASVGAEAGARSGAGAGASAGAECPGYRLLWSGVVLCGMLLCVMVV